MMSSINSYTLPLPLPSMITDHGFPPNFQPSILHSQKFARFRGIATLLQNYAEFGTGG